MIPHLYVPIIQPEDVVRHLGKQEKHWKAGRSAHALAYAWHGRKGFPKAIDDSLKRHSIFATAELIDGFFERQTDLGSSGRPSQTDLLAVVGLDDGLAILAVEAKAGESFGKYVRDWRDGSEGKEARLKSLCTILDLSLDAALPLRYQLMHRAASAILEAKRYRTKTAALLVHSFSDDQKGFEDFCAFMQVLGFGTATSGVLVGPVARDEVSLYAGWVQDDARKCESPGAYLHTLRSYAAKNEKECRRVRSWCDEQLSKR
jgi:uncharacterized protein DUF6946